MEEKILGSQEINATPAPTTGTAPAPAEAPKIGGIQTTPMPTAGVDMNFYANSNPANRISAGQSTGAEAADPWNKASDTISQISNNSLNDIQKNHIDTIGTERGGQQSTNVAGIGDTYMTGRYSSPAVANLVSAFRTTAAQNALSSELENEKQRLTKEAQKAYKERQKRDRARARARAAAQQAAAQQAAAQQEMARKMGGMGNVKGEATTAAGQRVRYANDDEASVALKYKEKMDNLSRSNKPEENVIPQLEEFRNGPITNAIPKAGGSYEDPIPWLSWIWGGNK